MSHVPELLDRNAHFATNQHRPRPILPTLNAIVISCLDARTDPAHFLGLAPGEALVLRNAGGRVTPAVEQQIALLVTLARQVAGPTAAPEIVLVHHTDCGMERLAIHDHTTSLADDLARLRASDVVPAGLRVTGLCYDQHSGKVTTAFAEMT